MKVTITGNGRIVAEKILNKGRRSHGAWGRMADRMGSLWLEETKRLSATQYASTAQLRKMGHPYAQRHFRAQGKKARAGLPAPSYFINRQTGKLLAGWKLDKYTGWRDIYLRITNPVSYFIYLHFGTRKMIRRPILGMALRFASRRYRELYEQAEREIHGM